MPKINLLEKNVYNRIAAGEVVDNPKSIVKELVENAIDAGSTEISVLIEEGGLKTIVVIDNGCGIASEEVKKAFLPHATSKIKDADDIPLISTLGFRGEALPSIASVSQVTMKTISVSEKSETGTKIVIKGGVETEFAPCALDKGTSIEVSSLFFNTPARLKFLKSTRTEEAYITSAIQDLILSNPTIAFRYTVNGELRYMTDGSGLDAAVRAVYPELFGRLIELKDGFDGFKISGYISPSDCSKSNRTAQTLIINGRVVSDLSLSASVQNAYGERLMTRAFPIYILDVIVPFDFVDVNVHPNKSEVRLQNPRQLYSFVYRVIKNALEENDAAAMRKFLDLSSSASVTLQKTAEEAGAQHKEESAWTQTKEFANSSEDSDCKKDIFADLQSKYDDKKTVESPLQNTPNLSFSELYRIATGKSQETVVFHSEDHPLEQLSMNFEKKSEINNKSIECVASVDTESYPKFHIVGQMFQNYIFIECCEKGYIIDQHAAHERTIYDKLVNAADSEAKQQQPLLVPYIFNCSAAECAFLIAQRKSLMQLGFDFDEFGSTAIKVNAVPAVLSGIKLNQFFDDLLSDINGIKMQTTSELLRSKLAQTACKSAIKAGDILSEAQLAYFIDVFVSSGAPLCCPHGRPTVIPFDKQELEKRFKRKL